MERLWTRSCHIAHRSWCIRIKNKQGQANKTKIQWGGGILNEFFFQIIIICNTQKRERELLLSHFTIIILYCYWDDVRAKWFFIVEAVNTQGSCKAGENVSTGNPRRFVVASACISSCSSFTRIKRKLTERSLDNELRERERGSTHKSNYEPHKRCRRRRRKRPKWDAAGSVWGAPFIDLFFFFFFFFFWLLSWYGEEVAGN